MLSSWSLLRGAPPASLVLTHRPEAPSRRVTALARSAIFALISPALRPVPGPPPSPAGSQGAPRDRLTPPCRPAACGGSGQVNAESGTAPSGGQRLGYPGHQPVDHV